MFCCLYVRTPRIDAGYISRVRTRCCVRWPRGGSHRPCRV